MLYGRIVTVAMNNKLYVFFSNIDDFQFLLLQLEKYEANVAIANKYVILSKAYKN